MDFRWRAEFLQTQLPIGRARLSIPEWKGLHGVARTREYSAGNRLLEFVVSPKMAYTFNSRTHQKPLFSARLDTRSGFVAKRYRFRTPQVMQRSRIAYTPSLQVPRYDSRFGSQVEDCSG